MPIMGIVSGAPKPESEERRLAALRSLNVLDTSPEAAFDRLTELARVLFDVPIALVSLVDEERQWFKSRAGLDATETPREHAFCAWSILEPDVFEVPDAMSDARFAANPLVQGDPRIRFYAGAPLVTEDGALGTLCVIDRKPRALDDRQRAVLQALAATAVELLESRRLATSAVEQTELLSIAEELAGVGHWRLDPRAGTLFWSQHVFRIHERDPRLGPPSLEEAIEAYHPDDRAMVAEQVARAQTERAPFEFEARVMRPGGETRLVQAIGRPLVTETDEVAAVFGVFRDITEDRVLQKRLAQAEKMASVGTLAAGVAHEINNPLSYIHANTFTLAEELEKWAGGSPSGRLRELSELVSEIRDGTQRIKKIVGGLKTFSRSAERRLEPVELRRVVEMASRLCTNELRHKARLILELPDATPVVEADESQLVQVAVNLIVNACHAIEEGAASKNAIIVRVGVFEGDAYFEVEDTGIGMSPETLRDVFTPFFTTKPRGVGTGLGLSICHGIVTSFGGSIDVDSTPGVGTRIRVSLASAPAPVASPDTRPAEPVRDESDTGRVLIVDDDVSVGRSLARLLRRHEVEVVTDPRLALQRLEAGTRWDTILCDLMMPNMSGPEFYSIVESQDRSLAGRMIMVTGGAFTEEGQAFLARSTVPVFDKPIDGQKLRVVVQDVIRQARNDPPASCG